MKKLSIFIAVFLLLNLPAVVLAKNESGSQTNQQTQISQQNGMESPAASSQVQNKNKTQTQNQGESQQIQTQTQENENNSEGRGEGMQTRSQTAIEHMSKTAQKVQGLLQLQTQGGIGDQVRQIAQDQKQAQEKINQQLDVIDSRKGIVKFLLGVQPKALADLKLQLEQNRLIITQLEQVQNQLYNQGDLTLIQETIQALNQENTSLQDKINSEEQTVSIFGWIFKLLEK